MKIRRSSSGAADLGVDSAGAEAVVVAGEEAGVEAGVAGDGNKVKAETKAVEQIMHSTRQHATRSNRGHEFGLVISSN